MKKAREVVEGIRFELTSTIIASLLIVLSTNLFAQTCPNTPITYPKICAPLCSYPTAAYYNDLTQPTQHTDNNASLIVTWPYNGSGYIVYTIYNENGEEGHYNSGVTIYGVVSFSSAPSVVCNGQTGTFTINDSCGGTLFYWSAPSG